MGKYRNKKNEPLPGFDFEAWQKKHKPFTNEIVPIWTKEVKEKYGKADTKFACVGYVVNTALKAA